MGQRIRIIVNSLIYFCRVLYTLALMPQTGGTRPLPVSQLKSRFARHARAYLNDARDTYVPVYKAPKPPKPRAAKKPRVRKAKATTNPLAPWNAHVSLHRAQHPGQPLRTSLQEAKETYHRIEPAPAEGPKRSAEWLRRAEERKRDLSLSEQAILESFKGNKDFWGE